MTATYFYFGHLVFSEYFSLRSELLMNCVENPLRWRLQTSLLFAFTEKNFFLFGEELLLRKLSIQSINESLENRDQTHLIQGLLCNISLST